MDAFKGRKKLTSTASRTRHLIVLPATGQNYVQEEGKKPEDAQSVHFVTGSSPTLLMLDTYLNITHIACHDLHQHNLQTAQASREYFKLRSCNGN
jgi:hypothetical protein